MSKWKEVSLSKIGKTITGKTPSSQYPEDFGDEMPFITPSDSFEKKYMNKSDRFLSRSGSDRLKDKIISPNSIMVTCIGSAMGKVAKNSLPSVTNQQINSIIVNENFDSDYIYYLLKNNYTVLRNAASGSTAIPILNKTDFDNLRFKVELDLNEQRKMVSTLSTIDDKIETNNQINQELEAMAKTLYDYWFVQFDFPDQNGKPYKSSGGKMVYHPELKREIPEGWGVEKLKDKLSVSRGISYTTENIKDNIGTPMINLASIDINRNYKSTGLKYFNGDYLKEKIVSGGDLLIACTDLTRNADIVGSPIIVPFDEQNYVFSMDLAKIDSKVDYINKYYLYSTLRTEHYHNYIKNWASGTNVLHLNIDGINWYSISIPPVELQEEYSKIILKYSKKTNKNIQENQQLSQLRDWLLPMLMNGQVKVQDFTI